jgi:hypothetical protein
VAASHLETALLEQILEAGLPEPQRELVFAPPRRWRFDFSWLPQKVACEVEGGVFNFGRHTRGKGFTEDAIKYSEAAIQGWCVVRVTGEMVKNGHALQLVHRALRSGTERLTRKEN